MIYDTILTIFPSDAADEKSLIAKASRTQGINPNDVCAFVIKKRSIDARRSQVKIHIHCELYVGEMPILDRNFTPIWKQADQKKRIIIVGSGPAGLFAALKLLEYGIKPIIIERGPETSQRKIDIASISRTGSVCENSNYCFGEGGAGTFSDGKLYTRSNKRGNIKRILSIFNYHGASDEILTVAHPHIGTDKLPLVINNINNTIRKFGGEVHFNRLCTSLIVENGRVSGIRAKNVAIPSIEMEYRGMAVILATGHSAQEVYKMVLDCAPKDKAVLEAKTFAMGVRVEHPRSEIDKIQYHGKTLSSQLQSAEYRLVSQIDGRGVYSFCMCPGGFVVPSSSSPDGIVVNGMSASKRNSKWSNSAIVVEQKPEDFADYAQDKEAISGLIYRQIVETGAKKQGQGQKAPAQMMKDFLSGCLSQKLIESSYTPGLVSSRLDLWLPEAISSRLKKAFVEFNKNMHGFISDNAILIAPETRTSTPVRILRDKESLESPALKALYPAGEGSGYSGGIVSSAMDGEHVAEKIASLF